MVQECEIAYSAPRQYLAADTKNKDIQLRYFIMTDETAQQQYNTDKIVHENRVGLSVVK